MYILFVQSCLRWSFWFLSFSLFCLCFLCLVSSSNFFSPFTYYYEIGSKVSFLVNVPKSELWRWWLCRGAISHVQVACIKQGHVKVFCSNNFADRTTFFLSYYLRLFVLVDLHHHQGEYIVVWVVSLCNIRFTLLNSNFSLVIRRFLEKDSRSLSPLQKVMERKIRRKHNNWFIKENKFSNRQISTFSDFIKYKKKLYHANEK